MTGIDGGMRLLQEAVSFWLPAFLDSFAKGVLLLSATAAAMVLLKRRSAAIRHGVWTASVLAVLAIPLLRDALPSWTVLPAGPWAGRAGDAASVPVERAEPAERVRLGSEPVGEVRPPADAFASRADIDEAVPLVAPVAVTERTGRLAERPQARASSAVALEPVEVAGREPVEVAGPEPVELAGREPVESARRASGAVDVAPVRPEAAPLDLRLWLLLTWTLGFVVLLSRMLVGAARVNLMARRACEASGDLEMEALTLAFELGIRRKVRFLVARDAAAPMTWGTLRPTVVLPAEALAWSPARRRHVLLHELAHVARLDHAIQMIAQVIRAVHWLNPLAWWAVERMKVERELACDDLVLRHGCRASDYAHDLVAVARTLTSRSPLRVAAALPMARGAGLGARVSALLDPSRSRAGLGTGTAVLVLLGTAALAVPIAALAPAGAGADARTAVEAPAEIGVEPADGVLGGPAEDAVLEPAEVAVLEPAEDAVLEPAQDAVVEPASLRAGERGTEPTPLAEAGGAFGPLDPPSPEVRGGAAQSLQRCLLSEGNRRRTSMNDDGDRRVDIEWSNDMCSVEIEIRGEVVFRDDERGVQSISRGGRFEIEEEIGRSSRRVRMEAGDGGRPVIEYWVDGDRRPWDAAAEAWFAQLLPDLFRQTGLDAEARVRRILGQSGVDGVLAEIDRMPSDHVSALYIRHLLDMAVLDAAQARRVLDFAARNIESDHYRAQVLLSVTDQVGLGADLRSVYLAATLDIDSDHYQHEVLSRFLAQPDLGARARSDVLDAASNMESDHYLASILEQVARGGAIPAEGRASYLNAVRSIESDHYTAEVVNAFLDQGRLSADELDAVLEMAGDIDSDHYLAELMQRIARGQGLDGALLDRYLDLARTIESDHYLGTVVSVILDAPELDAARMDLVLDLVEEIESDHQASMALTGAAERGLSSAQVSEVIRLVGNLDSDYAAAEVLTTLAREYDLQDRQRQAFIDAAERLESRHYRERALASLVRRR